MLPPRRPAFSRYPFQNRNIHVVEFGREIVPGYTRPRYADRRACNDGNKCPQFGMKFVREQHGTLLRRQLKAH
jgi:hypothetical protein